MTDFDIHQEFKQEDLAKWLQARDDLRELGDTDGLEIVERKLEEYGRQMEEKDLHKLRNMPR